MKAALSTRESSVYPILTVEINERAFTSNLFDRVITKNKAVSGVMVTTDWGVNYDRTINENLT